MDLSKYLKTNGSLSFDIRQDVKASKEIYLKIEQTKIKFSEKYNQLGNGKWTTIEIPLDCFVSEGLDLASVTRAFEVSSKGSVTFSLANLKLNQKAISGSCLR